MNLIIPIWFILPIFFIISLLFSMIGLGGGQIYLPILHWLGYPLLSGAIPLSLLLTFLTQFSSGIVYFREGMVDFTTYPLLISSIIFPIVGGYITTKYLPEKIILIVFAIILIITVAFILFEWKPSPHKKIISKNKRGLLLFSVGAIAGLIVGMLGRGMGTFIVPLLLWVGYSPKKSVGTSQFLTSISSLTGLLVHINRNLFSLDTLILSITVVTASIVGSTFMCRKLNEGIVTKLMGVSLFIVAIIILIQVAWY